MSAPALTRSTGRVAAADPRGVLRVLDGGATAVGAPKPAHAEVAGSVGPSRRVRLVRTLLLGAVLVAVLAGVFAAAWSPSAAAGDEGAAGATVTVVVDEGDSLWSVIGDRTYERDPRLVIDEVRTLNGMDTSVVHPGQRLILPAR
ncbi:MAG TPA: LysM peptidoglycan-binding domain-containing protein [Brevibacterium sp.]|nr:LysM peptidoglycan-binding domain-containing protein [Brevibacterium sp.]